MATKNQIMMATILLFSIYKGLGHDRSHAHAHSHDHLHSHSHGHEHSHDHDPAQGSAHPAPFEDLCLPGLENICGIDILFVVVIGICCLSFALKGSLSGAVASSTQTLENKSK